MGLLTDGMGLLTGGCFSVGGWLVSGTFNNMLLLSLLFSRNFFSWEEACDRGHPLTGENPVARGALFLHFMVSFL